MGSLSATARTFCSYLRSVAPRLATYMSTFLTSKIPNINRMPATTLPASVMRRAATVNFMLSVGKRRIRISAALKS